MTLSIPDLRRLCTKAVVVAEYADMDVSAEDILALIALAEQLKAAGERLVGAVEACAVADHGGPPVNWEAVDASQDAMRAALAAAREAGL